MRRTGVGYTYNRPPDPYPDGTGDDPGVLKNLLMFDRTGRTSMMTVTVSGYTWWTLTGSDR